MRRSFLLLGIHFALCAAVSAQSVWGVNGPAVAAERMTGPAAGPCAGYPSGPITGGFAYFPRAACGPVAGPFPAPGPIGDIAIDRDNDTVWITDGISLTNYTRAGAVIRTFMQGVLPGPLTGLGWGVTPAGPALFITNGMFAAGIAPPPPPGCAAP